LNYARLSVSKTTDSIEGGLDDGPFLELVSVMNLIDKGLKFS